MDEVVENLKACLLISKGGISENRIGKDYYEVTGERIPFRRFNFETLQEFLQVIPGIKRTLRGNEFFIEKIPSDKTAHLADLVRGQRSQKKKPRKVFSYNRPTRTPYGSNQNFQRNQTRSYTNSRTTLSPVYSKNSSQNNRFAPQVYNRASFQVESRVPSQSSGRSTTPTERRYQDSKVQRSTTPTERSTTPTERSTTPANSRHSSTTSGSPTTSLISQNGTSYKAPSSANSIFRDPPSKATDYTLLNQNVTSQNVTPAPLRSSQRPNYMRPLNETSPTKKMMNRDSRNAASMLKDGSAKPKSLQSRLIVPKTTTDPSQINLNGANIENPTPVLRPTVSQVPTRSNYEKENIENEAPQFYSMIPFEQFLVKKEPLAQKAPSRMDPPRMAPPQTAPPHMAPPQRVPQTSMSPQTPEAELASLTDDLKLPLPVYKILPVHNGSIYAQVTIGEEKYSSYPEDAKSEKAAQAIAAAKALTDFKEKNRSIMLPVTTDVKLLLKRILTIVDAHPSGVFTSQISKYYKQEFRELLPEDWMRIVNNYQEICVEVGANKTSILTRYTPPEKAQKTPLQSSLSELRLSPIGHPAPNPIGHPVPSLIGHLAPAELETPLERYWIVHVTVVRTSEIWGRLVGEEYSDRLNAMSQQMNKFYAKNFESTKVSNIEPNVYYSICVEDNWCRVRCLEYNPKTEEATLFFIDHGDDEIWHGKLLHSLDKQFYELPGQALRLSLHELEVFADSEQAVVIVEKYLQYQTLYVEVLSYDVEEDCTSVIFYDTQGPDDVNLNKLMSRDIIETCITKPHLKEGRITEVYVSHVSKTGDIYVQVKNESMQYLVDLMNEAIINKLSQDLRKFAVTKVNLTKLYMVKDEDGNWYRVSVMNVNYTTNEVDAFLIDFGKTITAKISSLLDLKSISEMLVQIPGQALQLHLHNVPPSSFDAEKVARLKELAPPNTALLVKEVLKTRTDQLSPPVVELLKRQDPSNEIITINNTLVLDEELPSPNNDDDNSSVSRTRKRSERLTSRYGSSADQNDPLQRNALKPPKIPPIGDYFDVHVTLAANPGNFVVQPHEDQLELINMMNDLQVECENYNGPPPTHESVSEGNLYAAQHSDTHWYRVCILNKFVDQIVTVYFCDYGDMAIIPLKKLQPLLGQFTELPYQAIRAKLADVKPVNIDWSVEDCLRFQELIVEKDLVSVVKESVLDPLSGDTVLSLTLIDVSDTDDVFVDHVLIDEGRAEKV